ncbi:MAG: class I SAM-dependent methyltransferase [Tepidisphaeraceae bacterium]
MTTLFSSTPVAGDPAIAELYRDFPVGRTGSGITYINIADDFVSCLSFANAGMLNKGNLLCFDYVMGHLPSRNPMIEIGSFCGLSTNLINYYAQKHGVTNQLFTSDDWAFGDFGGTIGHPKISLADYRKFVRESFIRNLKTFSPAALPHTVEKCSSDFFAAWSRNETATDVFSRPAPLGGPISFCYIDGDHGYPAAKADFQNTDRFLEPGGFILFDDSADNSHWGVCGVIEEVKRMESYELVVKNPNYLFRKRG